MSWLGFVEYFRNLRFWDFEIWDFEIWALIDLRKFSLKFWTTQHAREDKTPQSPLVMRVVIGLHKGKRYACFVFPHTIVKWLSFISTDWFDEVCPKILDDTTCARRQNRQRIPNHRCHLSGFSCSTRILRILIWFQNNKMKRQNEWLGKKRAVKLKRKKVLEIFTLYKKLVWFNYS